MKEIRIQSIKKEFPYVVATLQIGGVRETICTEICSDFFPYAQTDRIDAYVWGLLMFALQNGYDLVSELPITDELKYNLEYHLISPLCEINKDLHRVRIHAPITQPCEHTGSVVATGISCGVDSLYTIQQHTRDDMPPSRRINTLAFFNAGAAMKGPAQLRTPLVDGRLQGAMAYANEYGFRFLFVESDIHILINKYASYEHIKQHTFMMLFCVNILQPCIKNYYYSSGYPYSHFSLNIDAAAHYDLLLMFCASVGGMKFYSTGGDKTRIEKTRSLIDFPPAQKHLNVCVNEVKNDGKCFKCIRTQLTLDALGGLDKFERVFDVPLYKQNRFFYLKRLYLDATFRHDSALLELLPYFRHELTAWMKLRFFVSVACNHMKALLR